MYFWKTGQLATDIRRKGIDENDRKNYYLALGILTLLSIFIISISSQKNVYATLFEFISITIIYIIGINKTFTTNKRNSGKDYLGRMVLLSLPLTIKITLFSFFFGIPAGIYAGITQNVEALPWCLSLFSVAVQGWYFWRLNVHLKFINE